MENEELELEQIRLDEKAMNDPEYQLKILDQQIQKFSRITEIIAEGNFFFYHPREENLRPNSPIGLLARNFNKMVGRIKDYQENLEKKVHERTNELERSLDEITNLKYQQDGDYFLTSQLLKPLGKNKVKSQNVVIEQLVHQKKQFGFKQWDESLGGDICSSHNITLKKKPYILFMNSDAMGKSIQGAGGALVLGSVFEAIVQRTKISSYMQNYYPEKWLKEAFLELQMVMASFEGAMYATTLLGLIDEATGVLYFINAQHPNPIIYRDGKATYLTAKSSYSRLGYYLQFDWEEINNDIIVSSFRLKENDILFCGSDGKDDLVVGQSESGKREINNDESMFPRVIEESKGVLNDIFTILNEQGEIIDDVSILKISYTNELSLESNKKVLNQILSDLKLSLENHNYTKCLEILFSYDSEVKKNPSFAKIISKIYFNLKNYKSAINAGLEYLSYDPLDDSITYLVSVAYRKLKQFNQARNLSEILVLRDPTNSTYKRNWDKIKYITEHE
ncbi:MAG: SpoIIE family protein phosphatase [Leptospiraceae bacterium]|nr:SpoIIE family protein phosphatase [Leptospiraceae bacterium]